VPLARFRWRTLNPHEKRDDGAPSFLDCLFDFSLSGTVLALILLTTRSDSRFSEGESP
jgi:hypothetical protein